MGTQRSRTSGFAGSLAIVILGAAVATCLAASPAIASGAPEPRLEFRGDGRAIASLGLPALRRACPTRPVEVDDPYHGRRVRYFALPFDCVLGLGFGDVGGLEALRGRGLLLRALDGYTRPASGADLLEPGAYLAFGEVARMADAAAPPRFGPIDRRRVDPAPFYLVWTGRSQNDPHVHPWPYQLATIELASFAEAFPRTVPTGLETTAPGWSGYEIFQRSCASCHSINGEGGKVGPELNVPMNIVEYRPVEQIKSYIRDPQATRYTSMPAHPGLSEGDLDALVAYFEAMRQRKQDPRAGGDS